MAQYTERISWEALCGVHVVRPRGQFQQSIDRVQFLAVKLDSKGLDGFTEERIFLRGPVHNQTRRCLELGFRAGLHRTHFKAAALAFNELLHLDPQSLVEGGASIHFHGLG